MSFSQKYDGKVSLIRMPKAWSIACVDEQDPRFNAESPNLFTNDTANECFKFMVACADKFKCTVDAYIPDLADKLGRKGSRFTVEEIQGFDFTEYNMSFKTNTYGTQLMIIKHRVGGNNENVTLKL